MFILPEQLRARVWRAAVSGGFRTSLFRQVVGRMLVQGAQQECRRGWRRYYLVEDDRFSIDFFSVKVLVGVIVRTQRGTRQGDAGEETARARVGEDLGPHGYIGFSGGITANRAGGILDVASRAVRAIGGGDHPKARIYSTECLAPGLIGCQPAFTATVTENAANRAD